MYGREDPEMWAWNCTEEEAKAESEAREDNKCITVGEVKAMISELVKAEVAKQLKEKENIDV